MTVKFDYPVKLHRWTSEEFKQKQAAYVAKYGYRITIPSFDDILHVSWNPEPTEEELKLYRKKDQETLGPYRYNQIATTMAKKRQAFLNILGSPSPAWIHNFGTAMTFLDDINDALGTAGVVARTIGHALPSAAARFLTGPAGWLFTAAEIAGLGLTLSRTPLKAKRIQHVLHEPASLNPLSKKARLRRMQKLDRLKLSKGEVIEAMQVTDNLFGIGLCLGGIVGLVYDIPAGLYRHVRGEKVTIYGLPEPLLWFDRHWSRALKAAASFFMPGNPYTDTDRANAMYAVNQSTQLAQSLLKNTAALDYVPDAHEIQIPAPGLRHPSTRDIIIEAGYDPEAGNNFPWSDTRWMGATDFWENHRDGIISNVKGWYARNRTDLTKYPASQNAVEAAPSMVALIEGPDSVETDYDIVTSSLLKLMNNQFRFPEDCTEEQAEKWARSMMQYDGWVVSDPLRLAQQIANEECGFEFTTRVPERDEDTEEIKEKRRWDGIERLKEWYLKTIWPDILNPPSIRALMKPALLLYVAPKLIRRLAWLMKYGWPKNHPTPVEAAFLNNGIRNYHRAFDRWPVATGYDRLWADAGKWLIPKPTNHDLAFQTSFIRIPSAARYVSVYYDNWYPDRKNMPDAPIPPLGASEQEANAWIYSLYSPQYSLDEPLAYGPPQIIIKPEKPLIYTP